MRSVKKLFCLLSAATLIGISGGQALAEVKPQSIQIYEAPLSFVFNGIQYDTPAGQSGFLYKDSTYVPMRFVSYALEKAVGWDEATSTVSLQEPDEAAMQEIEQYNQQTIVPESKIQPIAQGAVKPKEITAYFREVRYDFFGEVKEPSKELPGIIVNDRLYVPLRFYAEAVDEVIEWDPVTYTVSSITSAAKAEAKKEAAKAVEIPVAAPLPVVPVPSGGGGGMPAAGGGIAIGGGAAAPTKIAQSTIIAQAEASIAQLQSSCESQLNAVVDSYLAAATSTQQFLLISQGSTILKNCDSSFAAIMGQLSSDLTNNGYNIAIVEQYQAAYTQTKDLAIINLLQRLGL